MILEIVVIRRRTFPKLPPPSSTPVAVYFSWNASTDSPGVRVPAGPASARGTAVDSSGVMSEAYTA